ncbi:MAG: O-antigen ligase family protein [Gemmataceae bacterium]|nr:O-antigen ligase family protein [Gemmataceae bacterium]
MIWLLGIYMWLCIHRPFEVWMWLGALQVERLFMAVLLVAWAVYPGKGGTTNRSHGALAFFTLALYGAWLSSPYSDYKGSQDTMDLYWKVVVFYVLVVTSVRTEANLRLLLLLFLAANAVYMLHSYYEYLCGRLQWRMGVSRMMGVDITYGDPNAFGATLLYTLPLLVPFWNERKLPRWLIVGYALLASFCILRTNSRAGFVGLAVWGMLFFVFNSRSKGKAVALCAALGLAAGVAALAVLPPETTDRIRTLFDPSAGPANAQQSASGRWAGFEEGLKVWAQSPLFGGGPATFAVTTGRGGQAHNLYGQTLSEVGLVGAIGLGLLVMCFFRNWGEARRLTGAVGGGPPGDFAYQAARALGFMCVLLLVMGWAGHNLFRYNWPWFAAFQACAVHCLRQRHAEAWAWQPRLAWA